MMLAFIRDFELDDAQVNGCGVGEEGKGSC